MYRQLKSSEIDARKYGTLVLRMPRWRDVIDPKRCCNSHWSVVLCIFLFFSLALAFCSTFYTFSTKKKEVWERVRREREHNIYTPKCCSSEAFGVLHVTASWVLPKSCISYSQKHLQFAQGKSKVSLIKNGSLSCAITGTWSSSRSTTCMSCACLLVPRHIYLLCILCSFESYTSLANATLNSDWCGSDTKLYVYVSTRSFLSQASHQSFDQSNCKMRISSLMSQKSILPCLSQVEEGGLYKEDSMWVELPLYQPSSPPATAVLKVCNLVYLYLGLRDN